MEEQPDRNGNIPPSTGHLEHLRRFLTRFDGGSVREGYAKDALERAGAGADRVAVVADPTLLPERADYEALVSGVSPPGGRYLFMYNVMLPSAAAVAVARTVASGFGIRTAVASVYQYTLLEAPRGLARGMSPDWLVAFTASADYVMASSFHGTVMGLVFGKPTLSLLNTPDEGQSRRGGLAGLDNRRVSLQLPVGKICEFLQRGPLPGVMDGPLALFRESSWEWLASRLASLRKGDAP